MDDFDRDAPRRSTDRVGRRREQSDDPPQRDSIRRRPSSDNADHDSRQPERQRRDSEQSEQPLRPRRRQARTEDDQTAPRQRYSERFRRQERYPDEEADDRSYRSTRDPYDRLRRVSNRPARRVEPEYDTEDEYDQFDGPDFEPAPRTRSARRPARNQPPRIDQQRIREVGALIANPAPELRPLVLGSVAAIGSLILLSILILIRSGSAGTWIPLHLDAEGSATSFGTKGALWRLPFFAFAATIMAFGLGWWLRARESYAVQYLTVGALMIHCLVWVGLINLLW